MCRVGTSTSINPYDEHEFSLNPNKHHLRSTVWGLLSTLVSLATPIPSLASWNPNPTRGRGRRRWWVTVIRTTQAIHWRSHEPLQPVLRSQVPTHSPQPLSPLLPTLVHFLRAHVPLIAGFKPLLVFWILISPELILAAEQARLMEVLAAETKTEESQLEEQLFRLQQEVTSPPPPPQWLKDY